MFLKIEETPNPNTLKFIPEKSLDFKGTKLFSREDKINNSSLLQAIFSVDGVVNVLLNSEFISVSKKENEEWNVLKTILTAKIGTALQKKDAIFNNNINKTNHNNSDSLKKNY